MVLYSYLVHLTNWDSALLLFVLCLYVVRLFIYCVFDIMSLVLMFGITAFLYSILKLQSSLFSLINVDDVLLNFTVIGLLFEASII